MKKYIFIGFTGIILISIFNFFKLTTHNKTKEITNENITTFNEITTEELPSEITTIKNKNSNEPINNSYPIINPIKTKKNLNGYDITCQSYNDFVEGKQDISIKYPQIEFISDEKLKNKINSKLYQKAFSFINTSDDIENLIYSLDYSITTFDNNILSVYFEHSIYYRGSMYPSISCDSLNIDLSTGENIKLFDLINNNQLLSLSKANDFETIKAVDDFEKVFSYENLIKEFLSYDNKENAFYIDNKKIALFITLPHAGGDFAIIETKNNIIK